MKKKLFLTALCALLAGVMVLMTACGGAEKEEETLYDVAIRVGCSDGRIYEFSVTETERHVWIPYDGRERFYWVDSYNLPDHPRYGDTWFSPSGEGANVFQISYLYFDPTDEHYSTDRVVCDRGYYNINIYADSTSNLWYPRFCDLFITVV